VGKEVDIGIDASTTSLRLVQSAVCKTLGLGIHALPDRCEWPRRRRLIGRLPAENEDIRGGTMRRSKNLDKWRAR